MTETGPWTRLLLATHAVLKLWDDGKSFDADSDEVWTAMEELSAASAATDLRQAATFDEAWKMLKQALELMSGA